MQPQDIAKETAKVVQNYLTFKAVQLVIAQLAETNPQESIWLRQYSSGGKLRDAEAYIQEIMSEPRGKELALRIMTVRADIAEQTLEFLPEMVMAGIMESNLAHRRHLLERLTQTSTEALNQNASETIEETEDSD
ncbi:MAG: RbcX chaperonin protein [Pleurocapsa sp. SU_5_0]|nr:RbcX chaperonin protein [Pleurocapsa sp. SU_5_0]NJO95568.1 RbcX chaperonin protein [Pleurocapsa sp. CRU_1_2]NJR47160.1 RbcX chaperonin protein [Hyellaceae cyanobacterium CSU_1_1]